MIRKATSLSTIRRRRGGGAPARAAVAPGWASRATRRATAPREPLYKKVTFLDVLRHCAPGPDQYVTWG
jgi:hypothetical protein